MRHIGMSLTGPAPADPPPATAEQLPDDPATLKRMVLELLASLHQRDRDYEAAQQQVEAVSQCLVVALLLVQRGQ